ncbi:efflux transporter outer membrane subunit [Novosphingobium sp.]|uniref:efflux transporter outer membrane subunit n=1 Tax=Novosphingobium sp. TaxID=1874826 RepID=UPI002FE236EF
MLSFRTPFALIAGASLLGGCNLAPSYHRPALAVPANLPQAEPSGAQADMQNSIPDIPWQTFFTDARLRLVIAQGLSNNRDLRIAAANVLQARATYRVQRSDLLPTVTASGDATVERTAVDATLPGANRDTESYSANIGLSSFELDLFGRLRNLSEAALQQYFATEEAQRSTRISLIAEIASAWLTLASDQDQLTLSSQTLDAYRQTLDLTKARFSQGIGSELEVRQAQTNYDQARYDIAVATTQIAKDKNALNLLVGATVTADHLPKELGTGIFTISNLPAGLASEVLLHRPDVRQAERQLIAQNANIGAARAAFFPTISLTASAGALSSGLSSLFGNGSGTWSFAPQVSVPIFNFGRNRANLRYAEAGRDAAIATYEKAVQTAFREVADALAQRGTIDEQLGALASRADAAAIAARLSEARYRAGVDGFLTTLDAERTLYAARQALVTAKLDRSSNLIELYRAFGGGIAG